MTDKFEKDILSEINSFRSNPRSIQHQIEVLQKGISRLRSNDPFLKEIDNFIASIDRIPKMKPLILNKTLCQIAREEVKKFIKNESSYNPYLTGAQMKGVVPSGFLEQNAALIADSGADEAETVVPKLLLNKVDKEKKGRQILCTPDYTQVGIASKLKPVVVAFRARTLTGGDIHHGLVALQLHLRQVEGEIEESVAIAGSILNGGLLPHHIFRLARHCDESEHHG